MTDQGSERSDQQTTGARSRAEKNTANQEGCPKSEGLGPTVDAAGSSATGRHEGLPVAVDYPRWRSMETAPKDRFVLLSMAADPPDLDAYVALAKWQGFGWFGTDDMGLTFHPSSHGGPVGWLPLPEPKTGTAQATELEPLTPSPQTPETVPGGILERLATSQGDLSARDLGPTPQAKDASEGLPGVVGYPRSPDAEMTKFLAGVVGVVEANSYERHMLWAENRRHAPPKTWVDDNSGLMEVIGSLGDMPVCLSLFKSTVDGHHLLFVDPTSQVVDHRMVDEWLKRTLPATAFRADGYPNRTDAMNFHNVFPRRTTKAGNPVVPDEAQGTPSAEELAEPTVGQKPFNHGCEGAKP